MLDNRGAGRSSVPPGPDTTAQMADDAAALLDHLGVPQAAVVGNSMGGVIAQEHVLRRPERVSRLILYATAGCPTPVLAQLLQAHTRATGAGMPVADPTLWLMPMLAFLLE